MKTTIFYPAELADDTTISDGANVYKCDKWALQNPAPACHFLISHATSKNGITCDEFIVSLYDIIKDCRIGTLLVYLSREIFTELIDKEKMPLFLSKLAAGAECQN